MNLGERFGDFFAEIRRVPRAIKAAEDIFARSGELTKAAEVLEGTPAYQPALFLAHAAEASQVVAYMQQLDAVVGCDTTAVKELVRKDIAKIYNRLQKGGTIVTVHHFLGYSDPYEEPEMYSLARKDVTEGLVVEEEDGRDGVKQYVHFPADTDTKISLNGDNELLLGGEKLPSLFLYGFQAEFGEKI